MDHLDQTTPPHRRKVAARIGAALRRGLSRIPSSGSSMPRCPRARSSTGGSAGRARGGRARGDRGEVGVLAVTRGNSGPDCSTAGAAMTHT
jgi:hypothetical protein